MRNFVAIGQTVAELWRIFFFFQDGDRRHVGFLNVGNINGQNGQKGNMRQCAIFVYAQSLSQSSHYGWFVTIHLLLLPRDAYATHMHSAVYARPGVCISHVGIAWKRLNESI